MAVPLPARRRVQAVLASFRRRPSSHLRRRDAAESFARMLQVLRRILRRFSSVRVALLICRFGRYRAEIVNVSKSFYRLFFSEDCPLNSFSRASATCWVDQPAHGTSAETGWRGSAAEAQKLLVRRYRPRPPVVSPTATPSVFPFANCVPLRLPPCGSPLQGRRRSLAMSAFESAGWLKRNCATKALRARW